MLCLWFQLTHFYLGQLQIDFTLLPKRKSHYNFCNCRNFNNLAMLIEIYMEKRPSVKNLYKLKSKIKNYFIIMCFLFHKVCFLYKHKIYYDRQAQCLVSPTYITKKKCEQKSIFNIRGFINSHFSSPTWTIPIYVYMRLHSHDNFFLVC